MKASPQKEHGYTPIANELLEAMALFRIPGEIRQVFDAIMRKTYGYNKTQDAIAASQLTAATGLKKQNVFRSVERLVEHKLVIKVDYAKDIGNILKINKDYHSWIPFVIKVDYKKKKKKLSSKRITRVIKTDDKPSSKLMDTKDKTILKDNRDAEVEQARLVRDLIEAFTIINPACKKMYGNTSQRQAAKDLIDTYTFDRVMIVITKTLPKTNATAFFPTITTPHQLFTDWSKLEAAILKYKSRQDIKNNNGRGLVE